MFSSRLAGVSALALILLSAPALAVSIGAGPSTINFGKMVKGGYAEQVITLSTSGDEDLTCTAEFTGDLGPWLSLDKGTKFELEANTRMLLTAIIRPPLDASNGKYSGMIYLKAAPTSTVDAGAGMAVGAGVGIRVEAEVTGREDVSLHVESINIPKTEAGYPINVKAVVTNTGNVRVKPKFKIDVLDPSGAKKMSADYEGEDILPTRKEDVEFTMSSAGLQDGEYTADVSLYARDELAHNQMVIFEILEEGSWKVQGALKDVSVEGTQKSVGDTIKVVSVFQNKGDVKVNAKFKGEVYLEEKLVGMLESDTLTVKPKATVNLESYYTPENGGRHVVRGYVIYEGIRTDTRGSLFEVEGGSSNTLLIVAAVVVVLLIVGFIKFIQGGGQDYGGGQDDSYLSDQTPPV